MPFSMAQSRAALSAPVYAPETILAIRGIGGDEAGTGILFTKPVQLRLWTQERPDWKGRVELP